MVDHSIETERAEPESRAADASWRALAPLIYPCVIAGLRQTTRSVLGSGGGAPVSAARRRGPRQPATAPSARGGRREQRMVPLPRALGSRGASRAATPRRVAGRVDWGDWRSVSWRALAPCKSLQIRPARAEWRLRSGPFGSSVFQAFAGRCSAGGRASCGTVWIAGSSSSRSTGKLRRSLQSIQQNDARNDVPLPK